MTKHLNKHLRLLAFYFRILALFTAGRWALSLAGADYVKTTSIFSLVTLALIGSVHHAAFARAFKGYSLTDAAALGATIGVLTQIVILASTFISYLLGISTFWNAPTALNSPEAVPFGAAMLTRTGGLVANTIFNTIAACIGYAMGGGLKSTRD